MLNGNDIVSQVVAALRDIPELVTELAGKPANIKEHDDAWAAGNPDVFKAVQTLTHPSILVYWVGSVTSQIRNRSTRYYHQVGIALAPDTGKTPGELARIIIDGIVTSTGRRFLDLQIPGLLPSPDHSVQRQTAVTGSDIRQDYFELALRYGESG